MEETRHHSSGSWKRVRFFGVLVLMSFAVTLAAIIGNRLSDQALAVLAGAACGVGAAIPTSLIIVSVTQRRRDAQPSAQAMVPQSAYPPVVVVTPQSGQQRPDLWNGLPPSLNAPMQRQFTVVGGTPINMEAKTYEHYS